MMKYFIILTILLTGCIRHSYNNDNSIDKNSFADNVIYKIQFEKYNQNHRLRLFMSMPEFADITSTNNELVIRVGDIMPDAITELSMIKSYCILDTVTKDRSSTILKFNCNADVLIYPEAIRDNLDLVIIPK